MNFEKTSRELQMQHLTIQHHNSSLLPGRTVTRDGAQHHTLNELNGHFRGMVRRLRKLYLFVCMCIYTYKTRKSDTKVWTLGMT